MGHIQRTFIPGSAWVYLKIYTGSKTADHLLCKQLSRLVCQLKKKGYITKWFFIRYADPDYHLRVRFQAVDPTFSGEILRIFYQYFRNTIIDKQVSTIQLDTYKRELERYGNSLIEETETIFYIDSECTLELIKKLTAVKNDNLRWMICLKMIDCFLSDFNYSLSERKELMEQMSFAYKQEFGFDKYNAKQFNSKFREYKSKIESILSDKEQDPAFVNLVFSLNKRSVRLKPVVNGLKSKLRKRSATFSFLLPSYIHMMTNRLFRSKNRQHELILYDFMRRYYSSEIVRLSYNSK